jgi:hypothetical protein
VDKTSYSETVKTGAPLGVQRRWSSANVQVSCIEGHGTNNNLVQWSFV